jgi:hypothetical protein
MTSDQPGSAQLPPVATGEAEFQPAASTAEAVTEERAANDNAMKGRNRG